MNITMGAPRAAVLTFFLTGAAGLGVATPANAQTVRVQKPFSLLVGGRGATGQVAGYFYTGASYAFAKSRAPLPASGYALYQVYVDYAELLLTGGSGAAYGSDDGGSVTGPYDRSVGFGPAVTYHFSPQIAPAHPFVGVGAGYYSVKVYDRYNATRLGGKILVGVEAKSGFLGELDYTYTGKADGTTAGGLGLRLGYRF